MYRVSANDKISWLVGVGQPFGNLQCFAFTSGNCIVGSGLVIGFWQRFLKRACHNLGVDANKLEQLQSPWRRRRKKDVFACKVRQVFEYHHAAMRAVKQLRLYESGISFVREQISNA